MERIEELTEKIAAAFSAVMHPGAPNKILDVPCCPEHDAWAEWLSRHTWQDLVDDLESEDPDPTGFSSILPAAYHYFLPGVLMFVVRSIGRDPNGSGWGKKHWRPLDWVHFTMVPWPGSEQWTEWRDDIKVDRLPLFSHDQKETVREILEFVAASEFGEKVEIQTAINEIWGAET